MGCNLLHCYAERNVCFARAELACRHIQATLVTQSRCWLVLPGGSSPQALLPLLAQQLDGRRIDLSPSDERWVPAQAAGNNWNLLQQGLPWGPLP